MNRREAIKNIGLTAGYIAATPTVLSILQSCTKEIKLTWVPELFSEDEAKILDQLVDLIIPETDTPGAKSLNVPMFVEKFINNAIKDEETQMFKNIAGIVTNEFDVNEDKPVKKIKIEEYDALLTKYLRTSKEQQKAYQKEMEQMKGPEDFENISKDAKIFLYLSVVRDLSIWGYKTHEEIGENVLAYLPVPGEQIGCESIEKLTGGKAWSL
ncbi:gluconate 2-dehydrogenase subunit 3 family protein [Aquimarina sp. MMG016]|uniref:gluconate 2-dehydrogenase subunit 3 family protein n=1 Tax=Aquimarina sp. MMG016 TaxID=2822690 RepID=UPI001B3A426E|nr:gluconate 2-dehydrogenase subunit 3 family protein [Aquimarina sp. MMG016]MBQ4821695.1 gluconate 2-dehydrogenase subunit 3 family protein [Aquimarina sp. MMG016]